MSEAVVPLDKAELKALAMLDEAIQAIWELPAIRESDFFGVVMPACQDIQQVVMRAARRPGAPA